jgi:hypothetical protein
MKEVICPYTKISEVKVGGSLALLDKFSFVTTAEAQGFNNTNANNSLQSLSDQLTAPFLILVGSFFLFIFLMSFVYLYHWKKFGMKDRLVEGFVPIYFVVLMILCVPLIFNLYF